MAFELYNWTCVSTSLSQPEVTAPIFPGTSPVVQNAPNLYMYFSGADSVATISGANYFLAQYASLGVGDVIIVIGSDASTMLQVTAVSNTTVTTVSFTPAGTVGTSNITNNAVTFAKMQQLPTVSLVGNATGGTANPESITLGNGLSFNGTALQVNGGLAQQAVVNLTLSQWLGMFATPVQLLPAPGVGLMNIVDSLYVNYVFGSANLVGGGVVGAQYGTTIHLGGEAASATEAATDYTAAAANTMFRIGGGLGTGAGTAAAINAAITLSNATAAFTVGTGGSFVVTVNFRTVSAT